MEQRVSLREANQNFARYVRAAEAGNSIVITRRGKPVARLSGITAERKLSPTQEAALNRLLTGDEHLGGRPPSRDELHER